MNTVIIEDGEEWGVSFTNHNPEPKDYVACASYEDAERLQGLLAMGWISVLEQLPPLGVKVITCDINGAEDEVCAEELVGYTTWSKSEYVSHWMDRPKLPVR